MAQIDFTNIMKAWVGNTQINMLHMDGQAAWLTPEGIQNPPFPIELCTTFSRFWDPSIEGNMRVTTSGSSNLAVLGDQVQYFYYAEGNRRDAVGVISGAGQNRVLANTSGGLYPGPTLEMKGGRRALHFNGTNTHLQTVQTTMNAYVFNSYTIAGLIWTDASSNGGVPLQISRGEYGSNRSSIHVHTAHNDDTPEVGAYARYRMDSSAFSTNTGGTETAEHGNLFTAGTKNTDTWQVFWAEFNWGSGNGTPGHCHLEFGDSVWDEDFTTSYGAEVSDGAINRLYVGSSTSASSPNDHFDGWLGRFFYMARTFTPAEREVLKDWLRGYQWVNWTGTLTRVNNVEFPLEVFNANTPGMVIDPYDPHLRANSSLSGSLVTANNTAVGRLPTISYYMQANTAQSQDNMGVTFKSSGTSLPIWRNATTQSGAEQLNEDHYGFFFDSTDDVMSANIGAPVLTTGFPKEIYSFAHVYIPAGWNPPGGRHSILSTYNTGNTANNYARYLEVGQSSYQTALRLNAANDVIGQASNVGWRLPAGWRLVESFVTINDVTPGGVDIDYYMDGQLYASVTANVDANGSSAATAHNTALLGAINVGAGNANTWGGSSANTDALIGRSGIIYDHPTGETLEKVRTWARAKGYAGPAFPNDWLDVFGAAYDPYYNAGMNTSTLGANVTSIAPVAIHDVRTDGGGTNTLVANGAIAGANTPLLAEIAGHRCWDTTGIRGLTANTLGIELFDSLEFTQAALVYVDTAISVRGVPFHHHRTGVNSYNSYAGMLELFTSGGNSHPYIRTIITGNNWVSTGMGNAQYRLRPYSESQWVSIIASAKMSAFTEPATCSFKVWMNGILIQNESISRTNWYDTNDNTRLNQMVFGLQLSNTSVITSNKDWNSYIGRFMWAEKFVDTNDDAIKIDAWLRGKSYTAYSG